MQWNEVGKEVKEDKGNQSYLGHHYKTLHYFNYTRKAVQSTKSTNKEHYIMLLWLQIFTVPNMVRCHFT